MNNRRKGAEGEREFAKLLHDQYGLSEARRGQQYSGTAESADVVNSWEGTHCEVKRRQNLNLHKAMNKLLDECGRQIPFIAHRKDREEWLITVRAMDLVEFCELVTAD